MPPEAAFVAPLCPVRVCVLMSELLCQDPRVNLCVCWGVCGSSGCVQLCPLRVCVCVYVLLLGMLGCEKCAKRGREIRPLARPDETPPVRAMGAGPDWLCVPAGSIPQHPFHCRWIHQAGQKL